MGYRVRIHVDLFPNVDFEYVFLDLTKNSKYLEHLRDLQASDVSGNFYLMEFSWSIFVKDIHVFYVNNAGKALFVWIRRRKDNEHLTSLVLGKYQQQELRTKAVNLQTELVNICHYGEETLWLGWLHSCNTFAVPKFTYQ